MNKKNKQNFGVILALSVMLFGAGLVNNVNAVKLDDDLLFEAKTNFQKFGLDSSVKAQSQLSLNDDRDDDNNGKGRAGMRVLVDSKSDSREDKEIPKGISAKLDNDKNLNFGWFNIIKRWFGVGSTTAAQVNLAIKDIDVFNVGTSTAEIKWHTKATTTAEVKYSTDASKVKVSTNIVTTTATSGMHTIKLTNLDNNTKYYFQITVRDVNGNSNESGIMNFRTKSDVVDTSAPTVLFSTVLNIEDDSARIIWITDEASSGKLWISTEDNISLDSKETFRLDALSYIHDAKVKDLKSSTKYFYKFRSVDALGNVTVSSTGSFTTK